MKLDEAVEALERVVQLGYFCVLDKAQAEAIRTVQRLEAERLRTLQKKESDIYRRNVEEIQRLRAEIRDQQTDKHDLYADVARLKAEIKRLQAEMRSLATSNGNTINDLEADLHMAWAKIDTALTLIENRSLNTTSASVMGGVIAALEGK